MALPYSSLLKLVVKRILPSVVVVNRVVGSGMSDLLGGLEFLGFLGTVAGEVAGLLALVALLGGLVPGSKTIAGKVVLAVASVAFDRSAVWVGGHSRTRGEAAPTAETASHTATGTRTSDVSEPTTLVTLLRTGESTSGCRTTSETECTPHRRAVGLHVTNPPAGIALLAIGRTWLGTVGRLVPRFTAVVAQPAWGLAVLGDVAKISTFEAALAGAWDVGSGVKHDYLALPKLSLLNFQQNFPP